MKKIAKTLLLLSSILVWLFLLACVRLIVPNTGARRSIISHLLFIFGRIARRILNIRVKLSGNTGLLKQKGLFLVCNHVSYIDGIVACGLTPLIFVGKADLRRWPFFGLFIALSETIFVNRTTPVHIQKEMQRIVSTLSSGVNTVFFPEGTSSNGEKLLPFKSPFFAAPLAAGRPIAPLVFSYKTINGEPVSHDNRDTVYWYGGMPFVPHLLGVLALDEVVLEVTVCESISAYACETAQTPAARRKELCEQTRLTIESRLSNANSK